MAKFPGFVCDSCSNPTLNVDKTTRTVRIDGPAVSGEYTEELCPECVAVPAGITLKAIRRRKRQAGSSAPLTNDSFDSAIQTP